MSRSPVSRLAAVAAGFLVLLLALAFVVSTVGDTRASSTGAMGAMSIDLDVTGNTATSLGPREECIVVNPGDTVTLDVTAEGIPAASPIVAYSFNLYYPPGVVSVIEHDPDFLLANAPGSELFPTTDELPDASGELIVSALDLSDHTAAAESGSGVLERLVLRVDEASPHGLQPLVVNFAIHIDQTAAAWRADGIHGAFIAIGTTCGQLPPAPAPDTLPPKLNAPTVGLDLDGPPVDLTRQPVSVSPGEDFTVEVVGWATEPPDTGEVYVGFDPLVFDLIECRTSDGDGCSSDVLPPNILEFSVVLPYQAKIVIGEIGLKVIGPDGACGHITVMPRGGNGRLHPHGSEVCVDASLPERTPTPSPSPPPITATPTQSPATTATPSAAPTPTSTAAAPSPAALPATGGRTGEARAGVPPVILASVAAAAAVGAGMFMRVRKRW